MAKLTQLPETLVEEILSYLLFRERRLVWTTCRNLYYCCHQHHQSLRVPVDLTLMDAKDSSIFLKWYQYHHRCRENDGNPLIVAAATAAASQTNTTKIPTMSMTRYDHFFYSLQSIDLSQYCKNAFLFQMGESLPNIKSLKCRGSLLISDLGLKKMAESTSCQNNLEILDVTYCRNTTFGATLTVRERCKNLKLVRRQPEWLDGRFYTPFAGSGDKVEVHTYFPDGTFTFSRDSQSSGFVCDLISYNDDGGFVSNKLQYNNFQAPLGWPDWTTFCYRPGVSLLNLPQSTSTTIVTTNNDNDNNNNLGDDNDENDDEDENYRCVLVCQPLRGLRPFRDSAFMERVQDQIPVGQSKYFDKNGQLLDEQPGDWEHLEGVVMISKMKVLPLHETGTGATRTSPSSSLLPPSELVSVRKETCKAMDNFGYEFLLRREEELRTLLDEATV